MDEITMNVKKKDPQDNSLLVTPSAFYSNERDKTKLNWFLFEYAAEFNSHIKRHLRKKLRRKKIDDEKLAALCIPYALQTKEEILDKLSGSVENVSLSYYAMEEFFPDLSDQLVDDLLTSAFSAWDAITEMCVMCPTRCISEKEKKAPMFDDPLYYE